MSEKVLTISALSQYIKLKFDTDHLLKNLKIQGEIADINNRNGIYYLKLKDDTSIISAVIFSQYVSDDIRNARQGDEVEVYGDVNLYLKTGSYQIYIRELVPAGIGKYYQLFEKTKKELEAEGYFDEKHKKTLPRFPKSIAIVTAPNSAALQDMLITLKNRYPIALPVIYPSRMQGDVALGEITAQLRKADVGNHDLILLARGGGSYEDLIVFNERSLAEAIFKLKTPIISGVGHEIDVTIADFVADRRSATPTAAMELAVPSLIDTKRAMATLFESLNRTTMIEFGKYKQQLIVIQSKYREVSPVAKMKQQREQLSFLTKRMSSQQILQHYIWNNQKQLEQRTQALTERLGQQLLLRRKQLEAQEVKLSAFEPMKVLMRGYAYVEVEKQVIASIHQVKENDLIDVHFHDGIANCEVKTLTHQKSVE